MALEAIGDIVGRMDPQSRTGRRSRASTWPGMPTKAMGDPNPFGLVVSSDPTLQDAPPPVICEYCGAPRYTRGVPISGIIRWSTAGPMACSCPQGAAEFAAQQVEAARREWERREAEAIQRRVQRLIGDSGIQARFLNRTFDTFEKTGENARALNAAVEYANTFVDKLPTQENPEPGRNGLFITGGKGVGKTHLAVAIANQLLSTGTAVICMTMIDLLERIKNTYKENAGSESDVLAIYKQVPLLVIDDMGKEPATEWGISRIYTIINSRYEGYMPTIVTTNYYDQQLIERMTPKGTGDSTTADTTVDRLREMCHGVVMEGQSWRSL